MGDVSQTAVLGFTRTCKRIQWRSPRTSATMAPDHRRPEASLCLRQRRMVYYDPTPATERWQPPDNGLPSPLIDRGEEVEKPGGLTKGKPVQVGDLLRGNRAATPPASSGENRPDVGLPSPLIDRGEAVEKPGDLTKGKPEQSATYYEAPCSNPKPATEQRQAARPWPALPLD